MDKNFLQALLLLSVVQLFFRKAKGYLRKTQLMHDMRAKRILIKRAVVKSAQASAEFAARHNHLVKKGRRVYLRHLKSLLDDPHQPLLDPAVRGVAIKFAKLPFGFIQDSCEGHFYKTQECFPENRVSLDKIEPRQKLFFDRAYFDVILDYSQPALELRAALKKLEKSNHFIKVLGTELPFMPTIITLRFEKGKQVTKKQALQIQRQNHLMISLFEKIVDGFVENYGVPVKL